MGLRAKYPWDVNSSGIVGDPTLAMLGLDQMPSAQQATNIDASQMPAPASSALNTAVQSNMNAGQQPGPAPRGSGKTNEKKVTGGSKDVSSSVQNTLYTPEQIGPVLDSWAKMPQFQQQQADIDNQRKLFGLMASQPTQTDLSPLARLTDSWYGTKLAEGYQKPQTPQEKLQTLSAYGNKIAGDQRDMTKGIVQAFGDSRSGQINQLSQLLMNEELLKRIQDPLVHQRLNNFGPQNFKTYEKFANDQMGGEKSTESATELKNLAQTVQDNDNPTALKELPLRLDKFITGSARISDSQIKMLGGDPSILNQLEQTIRSKAPELTDGGYLTNKNKQEYTALFQQYANERNKMRQLKKQWLTSPGQLSRHGVDAGAGDTAIPNSMVNIYSLPTGGTPAAAGAAPGNADPDAALKAAILKHLQDKQAKDR